MPAKRFQPAPELAGEACCLCGACFSVCPVGAIEVSVKEDLVKTLPECTGCGLCSRICPALNKPSASFPVKEMYTARTTLDNVASACQDGGVVSTLVVWALENGYAKAAILGGVERSPNLLPVPVLATSREEVVKCAGSRYTPSPNLSLLRDVAKTYGENEVLLVGLPCQVRAFRNIEEKKLVKYSRPIKLVIGLFCMESFPYKSLTEEILGKLLGVEPGSVAKLNIKKGLFMATTREGEKKSVKVSKLKKYARGSCRTCTDLTSELADISVGSIGSEVGWSTVFIRTEAGAQLFKEAVDSGYLEVKPLSEASLELINKLAEKKKKRGSS